MGFLKNLLGLGVAAGTAYAAVKVAQKYNEKMKAEPDQNGDGSVNVNDPVYGVMDAAREVDEETAAKVREIDPRLTIHDFRMVKGNDHTNLIFDIAVPFECKLTNVEITNLLKERIRNLDDGNYCAVIQIDRVYA